MPRSPRDSGKSKTSSLPSSVSLWTILFNRAQCPSGLFDGVQGSRGPDDHECRLGCGPVGLIAPTQARNSRTQQPAETARRTWRGRLDLCLRSSPDSSTPRSCSSDSGTPTIFYHPSRPLPPLRRPAPLSPWNSSNAVPILTAPAGSFKPWPISNLVS